MALDLPGERMNCECGATATREIYRVTKGLRSDRVCERCYLLDGGGRIESLIVAALYDGPATLADLCEAIGRGKRDGHRGRDTGHDWQSIHRSARQLAELIIAACTARAIKDPEAK